MNIICKGITDNSSPARIYFEILISKAKICSTQDMSMFTFCVLAHHLFPNHKVGGVLGTSLIVTKRVTILNLKGVVIIPEYVTAKGKIKAL